MTIWQPQLSGQGPLYFQLAQAIAQAIQQGDLPAGFKMPTHRALAEQLGVTTGTVTRAYREAEHQGWIVARIGDGTYVRSEQHEEQQSWQIRQPDPDRIDLWQNLPILQDCQTAFTSAIQQLYATPGRLNALMEYSSVNGEQDQRACVCQWLAGYGFQTNPDHLFFSFGAQNGLLLSLMACGVVGETILCEGLTYPGLKTLGASLRIQLKGLPMDEEGILPDALEKACQQGKFRVLYLNPTIHNPTTITMSKARRLQILNLADRYDLTIIEDDIHGVLPTPRPETLAELNPHRVILLGSFAKNSSAGLRTGYMVVPPRLHTAMGAAIRGCSWMITPLMIELTCQWITSGYADKMLEEQRRILREREQLLRFYLQGYQYAYAKDGMHAWLLLPEYWRSSDFVQRMDQLGIGVAGAELFAAGHFPAPQAVRLSLSHPADNRSLDKALGLIAEQLKQKPSPHWLV